MSYMSNEAIMELNKMKGEKQHYKNYLISNWKEAEDIASQVGSIDNETVRYIFSLLVQPYYYWRQNKE